MRPLDDSKPRVACTLSLQKAFPSTSHRLFQTKSLIVDVTADHSVNDCNSYRIDEHSVYRA